VTYDAIDPAIDRWVADGNLHLITEYKDVAVRSVIVVGTAGEKTQIWIDPPSSNGGIKVHVWNYGKKRRDFVTTAAHLPTVLNDALAIARVWLNK
jgi:hypothetical protein